MKEAYVSTWIGIFWIVSAIQRDVDMETEVAIQMDIKTYALNALRLLAASTDSNKEKIGLYDPFIGIKKVLTEGFKMHMPITENILEWEHHICVKNQMDIAAAEIRNLCTIETNGILAAKKMVLLN